MPIDFAAPHWFALAALLPLLPALKAWSRARSHRALAVLVAPRLRPHLVRRLPRWADWSAFGLQVLALLAFITALARPQWGFRQLESVTEGRNVFLAIDTSRSMLAEDLSPNRLARAKLAAQDLVRSLPTDRIGLIAFSGVAFIQAPLTVDHDAVLESIHQLDAEIIPRGGTNLAGPVDLALEAMKDTETSLAALVIFSDGEAHEGDGDLDALSKKLDSARLLVLTVGVGTPAGGIIPDPEAPGQFVKDEQGQVVRSRLDSAALRRISDLTEGTHVDMGGEDSVTGVVQQALRRLESQRLRAEDVRVPYERYPLPLAAGMVFLLLSHLWPLMARSRRATAALPLLFLASVSALRPDSAAAASSALAERQEAYSLRLANERIPVRRDHLHLEFGADAVRLGDLEAAKEAFGHALLSRNRRLQEQAHFFLGNALFETGRQHAATEVAKTRSHWEAALAHYDAALRLKPAHEGARLNRDFVRRQLEQLPPPPPEDEPPPQDQKQEPQEQEPQEQQPQPEDPSENPSPDDAPKPDPGDSPPENPPPDDGSGTPPPPDPPEDGTGDGTPPPETPEAPDDEPRPAPDPKSGQGSPPPPGQNWTASEARRILEQNADEDLNAKPAVQVQVPVGPFKNW
jgi:Ca-activated chloride channel family protein